MDQRKIYVSMLALAVFSAIFHGVDALLGLDSLYFFELLNAGSVNGLLRLSPAVLPFVFLLVVAWRVHFVLKSKIKCPDQPRFPLVNTLMALFSLAQLASLFFGLKYSGEFNLWKGLWLVELFALFVLSSLVLIHSQTAKGDDASDSAGLQSNIKRVYFTAAAVAMLAIGVLLVKTVPQIQSSEQFVELQKLSIAQRFCSEQSIKVCVDEDFCSRVVENLVLSCGQELGLWGSIRPQLAGIIEKRLRKCALLKSYDRIRVDRNYRRCLDSHSH